MTTRTRGESGEGRHFVPTVWGRIALTLIEGAASIGLQSEACCRALGLELPALRDSDARVPLESLYALFEHVVERTGDELAPLAMGRTIELHAFDAVALLMMTSPTIGAALDASMRYQRVFIEGERYPIDEIGDDVHIRYEPFGPARPGHRAMADDPDGAWLDALELDERGSDAALFVEPLVRLPADASLRADLPQLLSDLCEEGLHHRVLAPVRGRLIADSQASRAALPATAESLEERTSGERIARVTRARLELGALRCVSGGDVDALLDEASAHPDSLVAVAAVRALLSRDRQVSPATLARLGADPFSRADLLDALHRRGRELELAPEHRTERAIAEGHLLRALHVEGASPVVAYRWIERVEPRPGAGVHVFALTFRGLRDEREPQHVAVGPYPAVRHRGHPLLFWSDGWEDEHPPSAATIAEAMAAREESLEYTGADALFDDALSRDPELLP